MSNEEMSKISILHLSDIHFKMDSKDENRTVRKDVQDKMIAAIEEHIEENSVPNFVVVTGDVAFSGKEEEYKEAKDFFDKLKKLLPDETSFLVVPGNHDVDRDEIYKRFSLYDIVISEKTDSFLEDEKEIKTFVIPKFKTFRSFVDTLNSGLYESTDDYFWIKDFEDKNVSFLGLNTCWASEGDKDDRNIALGFPQVKNALERSKISNMILLMHHPFDWLNRRDMSRCKGEIFNGCSLILHGHNHVDDALVHHDPTNSCICLGANASYTNEKKDGFIGFQFINVNFSGKEVAVRVWPYRLDSREMVQFVSDTHRWKGQKNREYFDLRTMDSLKDSGEIIIPVDIPEIYRNWVKAFHSTMSVEQLAKKGEVITIDLPEVYIPLETANPFYKIAVEELTKELGKKGKSMEAEIDQYLKKSGIKEESTIDIEALMGRQDCILLKGDAGMGKTTLIKHLAYTITSGTCHKSLQDYLPVIVFLKEIWPVYEEFKKKSAKKVGFEQLLQIYLKDSECHLSMKVVSNFLSRGKALFLIDGLDEVPENFRPGLVEIIASFIFANKKNRFLLTGRPHGTAGKAMQRFGKHLQDINYLDEDKIKVFISNWFRAISNQATGLADVTAEDMISDIKRNEYISVFTQNPLLLTAVCILYQVGKRIPEQRADLYDRIVKNLLWRRFYDPGQPGKENEVQEYLMLLAYEMQQKNLKTFEKGDARQILRKIFPPQKDEPDVLYKRRLDFLFDEIEPKCGLFNTLSSGEIEFTHLTFQEFLAAKHMVYMEIDYKQFLEKAWWEEALLLYAGLLSLEMKKRGNNVVKDILNSKPVQKKNRFRLWLLGAKALRDFQEQKREDDAVSLARDKLSELIESDAGLTERFEAGEILASLGDTRIRKDNMILVKKGEFIRGSDKMSAWEEPEQRIYLRDFMIGKYPVTNEEYKGFIDAGGYSNRDYWTDAGWQWKKKEKIKEPLYWHDRKWNGPNFPVVGVSWYEANAYAKWLSEKTGDNYRLPTEAEWEKAARGTDGREYPWGDGIDKNKCNYDETGLSRTSPVGIFPEGKSPYGCFDMAGNVWEWCSDWFDEEYYKKSPDKNPKGPSGGSDRVMRGGCWFSVSRSVRCAIRYWGVPADRDLSLGFRLSQDV